MSIEMRQQYDAVSKHFLYWVLKLDDGFHREWALLGTVGALIKETGMEEGFVRRALGATGSAGFQAAFHLLCDQRTWTGFSRRAPMGRVSLARMDELVNGQGYAGIHGLLALLQPGNRPSYWLRSPGPRTPTPDRNNNAEQGQTESTDKQVKSARDADDDQPEFKDQVQVEEKELVKEGSFLGFKQVENQLKSLGLGKGENVLSNTGCARLLGRVLAQPAMSEAEVAALTPAQILSLPLDRRWALLNAWRATLLRLERQRLTQAEEDYSHAARANLETRRMVDAEVMRKAKVVAMTTSGAAQNQSVLQSVKPPIVIVEEAAEVFEAHLLTSLSSGCQHLIMIGDHQQLRPKPEVYRLETDYHLNISLFERLINNDFPYAALELQHRMRPAISAALMPHFYPKLRDHPHVLTYPPVEGLTASLYAFQHTSPESTDASLDKSKKNEVEAVMATRLALYLRQQGYEPEQITILACYVGQSFILKKEMDKFPLLAGIRVAVVDNYQGEESDIIILSLVRSNGFGRIGFLSIPNRVCVALSRARHGCYILGNLEFLAANSKLWADIKGSLERRRRLERAWSEIQCSDHKCIRKVACPADFATLAPEGGCRELCTYRLQCGHTCPLFCHPYDPEHKAVNCTSVTCERKCPEGYPCRAACAKDCPPCRVELTHVLACGHVMKALCFKDKDQLSCEEPCGLLLDCGHPCIGQCSKPCPPCTVLVIKRLACGHNLETECRRLSDPDDKFRCKVAVKKELPCGHSADMECYESPKSVLCEVPCQSILNGCGHTCQGSCGTCCQGDIHMPCQETCGRQLICGHACEEKCTEGSGCGPCTRPSEPRCYHDSASNQKRKKGKKAIRECGAHSPPCNEKCAWNCPHHKCQRPQLDKSGKATKLMQPRECWELCERPRCLQPCAQLQKCSVTKGCKVPCQAVCEPGEDCLNVCVTCEPTKWSSIKKAAADKGFDITTDSLLYRLPDCSHILPVTQLDRCIDEQASDPLITAIAYPLCDCPLRRSLRYSAVIRLWQMNLGRVKAVAVGNQRDLADNLDMLKNKAKDLANLAKTSLAGSTLLGDDMMQEGARRLEATLEGQSRLSKASVCRAENALLAYERLLEEGAAIYLEKSKERLKLQRPLEAVAMKMTQHLGILPSDDELFQELGRRLKSLALRLAEDWPTYPGRVWVEVGKSMLTVIHATRIYVSLFAAANGGHKNLVEGGYLVAEKREVWLHLFKTEKALGISGAAKWEDIVWSEYTGFATGLWRRCSKAMNGSTTDHVYEAIDEKTACPQCAKSKGSTPKPNPNTKLPASNTKAKPGSWKPNPEPSRNPEAFATNAKPKAKYPYWKNKSKPRL